MVLPESRYSLRLESGDRAGENVSIPAAGLSVGRRPENALQIQEGSVSGLHAELKVDDSGVTLRDLGSTNGTRVGSEKITERRLAHGDAVVFGNVRTVFLDASLVSEPAAAPAAAAGGAGEDVRTLGADRVQKSGSKGLLGLVAILVLVAGGAGAALAFLGGGGDTGSGGGIPVVEVPGNLLDDFSFEGDMPLGWEPTDSAPEAFFRDGSFRAAGSTGLGVELAADLWARSSSPELTLRGRRVYELRAALAAEGQAEAAVGLELSASDGSRTQLLAWSETVRDSDGFEDVVLRVGSLSGYDRLRVVVEASATGDGSASLDDVSLVEEQASESPAATFEDYGVQLIGTPARTAILARGSDVVLGGIRLRAGQAGVGPARWTAGTLGAESLENGLRLKLAGAGAGAELVFSVETRGGGEGEGFFATTGPDGFRAYTSSFEDVRADALLLGRGIDLLRVAFPAPVTLTGTLSGGALRVAAQIGSADTVDLQLSFREERKEANLLAADARDRERKGEVGTALSSWSRLLDAYPFEAALVAEAEGARTRLLQEGLERLGEVRGEVERARFFGLADLFRQCQASADSLASRYAGSEVEVEAQALAAAIGSEVEQLDSGRSAFERERLEAVLGVVEGREWQGLADHLRGALGASDGNN
ncbi:MAG: FHA domain-containing protein [Planctomycetota bacterium]